MHYGLNGISGIWANINQLVLFIFRYIFLLVKKAHK